MQQSHIEHPVYVESDEQLHQLCQQWQQVPVLALDTEFIRTDTFYPIAGLLQLSDGKGCFLIDPLTIDDFSPLAALMTNHDIIKVLHSCSEDLEVFDRLLGVLPAPLLDTQIGAAMIGLDFSMSYQRLVDDILQIHVPKGETRSNWLQRPLTQSQIHYAALDVAHLHDIYAALTASLERQGRLHWWQQECAALADKYIANGEQSEYYKKVKSAWKLNAQQLCCLQALTQWREAEARQRDVPRGRVVKDQVCFDIALMQPSDSKGLSAIENVHPKTVRKDGEAILAVMSEAQERASETYPERLPRPLPPEQGAVLKSMKALVKARAAQLAVPTEILVKKRDYEALLRSGMAGESYQLPSSLSGWREQVIGKPLLELLGA
jgi:ribonuclease D